MDQATTVMVGVSVYMALMLVVGFIAARRTSGFEDFAVAGRSLPLSITAATALATWLGAGTILGSSGAAYEDGFLGIIADPPGAALALILAAIFMVRMLRRLGIISVIDVIEQKYGAVAAVLGSISLLILYITWSGAQLVAFGFILSSLSGLSAEVGMIIGTIVVLIYTVTGGMWAVALTDLVQAVLITTGLLALGAVILEVSGGWSAALAAAPPGSFDLVPRSGEPAVWIQYARDWSILAVGNLAAQDLMQRAFAAKTERIAVNGFWIAGVGYLVLGMVPVMIGIFGIELMPEIEDPEFLVPMLAQTYLGPLLLATFLGAILAAIMSSADSALLASASVVSSNMLNLVRAAPSDRMRFWTARATIFVVGCIGLGVGLASQEVFELVIDAASSILVVLVPPMFAALYWPHVNRSGAIAGMVAGSVVWLGLPWIVETGSSDFLGFLANAVLMVSVSLATQRHDLPQPLKARDGEEVPLKDRLGWPG